MASGRHRGTKHPTIKGTKTLYAHRRNSCVTHLNFYIKSFLHDIIYWLMSALAASSGATYNAPFQILSFARYELHSNGRSSKIACNRSSLKRICVKYRKVHYHKVQFSLTIVGNVVTKFVCKDLETKQSADDPR